VKEHKTEDDYAAQRTSDRIRNFQHQIIDDGQLTSIDRSTQRRIAHLLSTHPQQTDPHIENTDLSLPYDTVHHISIPQYLKELSRQGITTSRIDRGTRNGFDGGRGIGRGQGKQPIHEVYFLHIL
jgi:hypothetical protein